MTTSKIEIVCSWTRRIFFWN